MFSTLGETQPKGGGGGGDGPSREDIVSEKASDILSKMPEAYIEEEYKVKINKLGEISSTNATTSHHIIRALHLINTLRYNNTLHITHNRPISNN